MKRVNFKDKALVIDILMESFKDDPYMHWLISDSNNSNKLKYVLEYVVDETLENGEVYLSDDNRATALWHTERPNNISLRYLYRNSLFFLRFGVKSTISIIKKDSFTHNQHTRIEKYYHLYFIGVKKEGQGKGLASELMNPMLEKCSKESIPVLLETANPLNVDIYSKKGFTLYNTVTNGDITIYFMKK